MCVQNWNWKFVALPIPEIIGGTQKIWAVPGYAHAPFSPKFLMGFCSHRSYECINVKKTTVLNTLVTMTMTSDVENSKN